MTDPHPLANVVGLYRLAGRPSVEDHVFRGQVDYAASKELLTHLHEQNSKHGSFRDLSVDGASIDSEEVLPSQGQTATFVFVVSLQGDTRFFSDAREFIGYPGLGRGKMPGHFYLIEEDYLHGEEEAPPSAVRNLLELTTFVKSIAEVADHVYTTDGSGANTLLFRTNDQHGLLETKLSSKLLGMKVPAAAIELVDDLRSQLDGIHQKEKRWMFSATMCEVLKGGIPLSEFIGRAEWWAQKYEGDLKTYLSGFSLEESKRKVADAHAQFAGEVSKIFGDITTKVLNLPLSVAIVVVLRTGVGSAWPLDGVVVLLLAAMFTSFVIWQLVSHSTRVVRQIDKNIDLVFGKEGTHIGNIDCPEELQGEVGKVAGALRHEIRKLLQWLCIYKYCAGLPIVAVCVLYFPEIWSLIAPQMTPLPTE